MQLTTWPIIVAQALLATWLLHLSAALPAARRVLLVAGPGRGGVVRRLAAAVVRFADSAGRVHRPAGDRLVLLIVFPERLSPPSARPCAGFGAFAVAVHTSHLPLALGLIAVLVPLRRWLGAEARLGSRRAGARARGPAGRSPPRAGRRQSGRARPRRDRAVRQRVPARAGALRRAGVRGAGPALPAPPLAALRLSSAVSRPIPIASCGIRRLAAAARRRRPDGLGWRPTPSSRRRCATNRRATPEAFAGNVLAQLTRFATGDGLEPWPATVGR